MLVLLVTGARKWTNRVILFNCLEALRPDLVLHGSEPGVDSLTEAWARITHVSHVPFQRPPSSLDGDEVAEQHIEHMLNVLQTLKTCGWEARVIALPLKGSRHTFQVADRARLRNIRVDLPSQQVSDYMGPSARA